MGRLEDISRKQTKERDDNMQYKVEYYTGVYKVGCNGWRQEPVTAILDVPEGKKTGTVISVLSVGTGRTSKRQSFFEDGIAKREMGMRKRLSAVNIIESV